MKRTTALEAKLCQSSTNNMKIGNFNFDFEKEPVIMGILNVTPDSFSDGGKFNDLDRALKHTEEMINDGAKIIDIGGESTRPGYTLISDAEEIERTAPIIEAIKNRFDIATSLDTYKAGVAEAGIEAGVDMINDIWGLRYPEDKESRMAEVVAKSGLPICIMHNRDNTDYNNYLDDFMADMQQSIDIAKKAGIADEQIMLDPGVGFGKTFEHNLQIINNVDIMHKFGYPILLGTSRKSVIGIALDVEKDERMPGTVATTVIGLQKGCGIFRVHDVKENYQAMMMTKKIMESGK